MAKKPKDIRNELLADNETLQRLWRNEDFQWYLNSIIKPRLKTVRSDIDKIDLSNPLGQHKLVIQMQAWQYLRGLFSDKIFEIFQQQARQIIDEIEEKN